MASQVLSVGCVPPVAVLLLLLLVAGRGAGQASVVGSEAFSAEAGRPDSASPDSIAGPVSAPGHGRDQQPGEILVKLRRDSAGERALRTRSDGCAVGLASLPPASELAVRLAALGVREIQPAFRVANAPARGVSRAGAARLQATSGAVSREDLFRWYRLTLATNADVVAVAQSLRTHPDVEASEPNLLRRLTPDVPPPLTGLPDGTTDPDFDTQWHLTAAKIPNAWAHLKQNGQYPGGSRDVIVAVIDTGVDHQHPELVGAIWTNSAEIPGNGLDDDGDGFVDDVHGCSTVADSRSHSGDSLDQHGHGTHVAGIVAATAFNHQGGVGVAFNVQIMAVRAAQYSGTLTTLDVAEGVLYAIDHGAEVINMSFGGYSRSQIEEDALEVALSQAVLVAAAGNDGLSAAIAPAYPAALPYVHGVMASTPAGKRAWFSNYGYDLAAPGVSIWSTLPGNQYAAWSGTSMATPIVSGIAALMRSYFWQRDIYPVRFLMGGLWASGQSTPVVDAYRALTELPVPGVTLMENWLFDDPSIDARNDQDGRVDSGETLHLAVEVINRAGQARNVRARLSARAEGAVGDDPFVTFLAREVALGDIGPWNTADNGFIYNAEGVITGVTSPLVFKVAADCPNDHVIPFELTLTFEDGWDPEHPTYTRVSRFRYVVQRGRNLPAVISRDYTLTADEFWMVGGPVLVEPGVTLTVEPGTQVQWGAVSDDPYHPGPQSGYLIVRGRLDVQGTPTNPVRFFPSYLVAGQRVSISVEGGPADLVYARVTNPDLGGFRRLDHCVFTWDALVANVRAQSITASRFHKFRGGGSIAADFGFERCLFDAGWVAPAPETTGLRDCVILQDYENGRPFTFTLPVAFSSRLTREAGNPELFYAPVSVNGETFVVLPVERGDGRLAETIANFYGGHLASIRSEAEWAWMRSWLETMGPFAGNLTRVFAGLTDAGAPGQFQWIDGAPLSFTAWGTGQPQAPFLGFAQQLQVLGLSDWGGRDWSWQLAVPGWPWRSGTQIAWWKAFVLRLPGEWSVEALIDPMTSGAMLEHVRTHFPGAWQRNAFLNRYWDPNVNSWMRWVAVGEVGMYATLRNNYLGTDTPALIDHAIVDYHDNFVTPRVDYGTPPAHGYPTTYPFVDTVLINGENSAVVPQLESGPATFAVTFNRDMDTNVEPFVAFGPAPPHSDFPVKPRDANFLELTNGWVSARTWQGQAWITPVTGNGYHLVRISGAVAADDPWLVSGDDVGRFRFKVQTVGVAAMTLQAAGGEGRIELTWQQNDFDLVAGYHVYRAAAADGAYVRLNTTLIPPDRPRLTDTNVQPAVPMFYKFTVVTTDFQESEFSNAASAAAHDTVPPGLSHTPVVQATPGRPLRLAAVATDNVQVTEVMVYYRAVGAAAYTALPMLNVSANDWSANLPASAVQPPGLEYYLVATDGGAQTFSGTAATPHRIVVADAPTLTAVTPRQGPASGGTPVTLSGLQFQTGCSVLFGGVLASNIAVLNPNQITCITPPHFPALVEVKLLNPNGAGSTLLNGYAFESTGTVVSLPEAIGDFGANVDITIAAANLEGLRAVDLTLLFDPAILAPQSARPGALTSGWSLTANLATPGHARISLAGATVVSGSGPLAVLTFAVVGRPPASGSLTLTELAFNDGALAVEPRPGRFTVNGFWRIEGTVRYFDGGRPVPNTRLSVVGVGTRATTTDAAGMFGLADLPTGSYTLTPSKEEPATDITAYDASLVLQTAAGLLALSEDQTRAADVNRNGFVSSMDAAYILERAVGLLELPFPNAGRVWDFAPEHRDYGLLNTDQAGQDFTAVLIGDVSGNWTPPTNVPPGQRPGLASPAPTVRLALDTALVRSNRNQARLLFQAPPPGIYSLDLLLAHQAPSGSVRAVERGAGAGSALLASNTGTTGQIRVALASAQPLLGDGVLLAVELENLPASDLRILSATINEGAVPTLLVPEVDTFDEDGDRLLDADEVSLYRTDPHRGDTDGDGMSDGAEVVAGTDPLSLGSVLKVARIEAAPDQAITIVWPSVPGRRYQLCQRNGPHGDGWEAVGPVIVADGLTASTSIRPVPSAARRFYRIRVAE